MKQEKLIEWFLRIALSVGFLSAVADRFGLWSEKLSAWGNWQAFARYTNKLLPFLSPGAASFVAAIATILEVVFAIALLTTFKTPIFAWASGFLLLSFAITMTFASSIKTPLDYSVYTASAGAFALSLLFDRKKML